MIIFRQPGANIIEAVTGKGAGAGVPGLYSAAIKLEVVLDAPPHSRFRGGHSDHAGDLHCSGRAGGVHFLRNLRATFIPSVAVRCHSLAPLA